MCCVVEWGMYVVCSWCSVSGQVTSSHIPTRSLYVVKLNRKCMCVCVCGLTASFPSFGCFAESRAYSCGAITYMHMSMSVYIYAHTHIHTHTYLVLARVIPRWNLLPVRHWRGSARLCMWVCEYVWVCVSKCVCMWVCVCEYVSEWVSVCVCMCE
jgi:hypothetical protein